MNAAELVVILGELAQTVRLEAEARSARGAVVLEDLGIACVRFIQEAPQREVAQLQVHIDLRDVCMHPDPRALIESHLRPLLAAVDGLRRSDSGDRYPAGAWVEHYLDRMARCERCGAQRPVNGSVVFDAEAGALPGRAWQRESEWRGLRPVALAVPCFPSVPDRRKVS